MRCPSCEQETMRARPTSTGVELDRCEQCGSIWFDRGEVLFFVRDALGFDRAIQRARQAARVTERRSPVGPEPLLRVELPGGVEAGLDRAAGGLWISGEACTTLAGSDALVVRWREQAQATPLRFRLGSLALRSLCTLTGLYALLSLVLITVSLHAGVGAATGLLTAALFVALQFLISPWFMDLFLRWAYRARFVELGELPEHLARLVERTAEQQKMKRPRFALIPDLSPNAFTYGHTPQNARVVLTAGTIELLEPVELEAVVAHELGHARNWDMALMTAAQLVPLVLFYLYRWAARAGDDKEKGATAAVAVGAYVLYIISEYIVLWFSRTREYHADRFAAGAVGEPAALARALVKIGYGLAGRGGTAEEGKSGRRAQAIGALGIFDQGAAQTLALTTRGAPAAAAPAEQPRYSVDAEALKGAMKWDLWNPWARWFELHSTHPLVAKRLLHLSNLSEESGQEPLVRFDLPQPESYWDEFFVDLGVKILPTVAFIATVVLVALKGVVALGAGLLIVGAAMIVKLLFRYPRRHFPEMSVATLLRQVKVSDVRPVPCRLEGTVRGRGVPGLIWSEDFVMQDETGIIFLDHRQPLSIWEFLWGWLRGQKLVGGHVVVEGWYRRSPVPFVEIKRFTVDGVVRRSWLRHFRWIQAIGVAVVGLFLLCFASGL
jgi:Zn-dependent protease with chaperone function/Zn-finger nucleic acid-binding protein